MNGKRTFWSSIIAGAVAGGLLSLLNRNAREYSKNLMQQTGQTVSYFAKNPKETVQLAKGAVETVSSFVDRNSTSTLNAIEQVEKTVDRFTK